MKATRSLLAITVVLLSFVNTSLGCTAFLLKGNDYSVVGFNENWSYLPGILVVNKRGLHKHNLSWARLTSREKSKPELNWTSKYGSVTFSVLGIDLPCYGMNEPGLFVVELFLDKTYSRPDASRPNMFWAQWIQYQLDNYATVDEVVRNLPKSPVIDWWPKFPGSHFFVSDTKGNTAVIEFIDGMPVVSSGEQMPVQALANSPYADETNRLRQYKSFGGDKEFDVAGDHWKDRFQMLAYELKSYQPGSAAPTEYAWKLLDRVRPGVWQLVADVKNKTLYFRTAQLHKIKKVEMAKIDFSTGSAIRYADLHLNFTGDVTERLLPWTPEINQAYVQAGFPAAYEEDAFYRSPGYSQLLTNLKQYAEMLQAQVKQTH